MAAKRTVLMVSSVLIDRERAPRSAFEPGGGDALDQQPLEAYEEREHRQQRHGGHREERPPIRLAGGIDEAAQAQLHGIGAHVVEIDQRTEEVVPGEDEGEDSGGRERRQRERQDDAPIDAKGAATVDLGGLVELARQTAEELHQQEDEEGVDRQELRHHQRQEGVDPAEAEEQ